MTKQYRAVPADKVTAGFSVERKKKIAARAAELIAEESPCASCARPKR